MPTFLIQMTLLTIIILTIRLCNVHKYTIIDIDHIIVVDWNIKYRVRT